MTSEKIPACELKRRGGFELIRRPGPRIEVVPSPGFRGEQHGVVALTMCVALKPRIAKRYAEQRSGRKAENIREARGFAFAVVVGRSSLRKKGVDVGELSFLWKDVERKSQNVVGRKDGL